MKIKICNFACSQIVTICPMILEQFFLLWDLSFPYNKTTYKTIAQQSLLDVCNMYVTDVCHFPIEILIEVKKSTHMGRKGPRAKTKTLSKTGKLS